MLYVIPSCPLTLTLPTSYYCVLTIHYFFITTSKYFFFFVNDSFQTLVTTSAHISNHCITICHFSFNFCSRLCPSWVIFVFHSDNANSGPATHGHRRNNNCVWNFRQSLSDGKCVLVWRANANIPTPSAAFTEESIIDYFCTLYIIFKLKTYVQATVLFWDVTCNL